jgi:hypothetical protein
MTKTGGRCIEIQVDGEIRTLCTIGKVASALDRSSWTIRHWQHLGLFPETPFFLNPEIPRTRRRLFPETFVKSLAEIGGQGFVGQRLDRKDWDRFHHEVLAAYKETVTPLISAGVTEPSIFSAGEFRGRQGKLSQIQ